MVVKPNRIRQDFQLEFIVPAVAAVKLVEGHQLGIVLADKFPDILQTVPELGEYSRIISRKGKTRATYLRSGGDYQLLQLPAGRERDAGPAVQELVSI